MSYTKVRICLFLLLCSQLGNSNFHRIRINELESHRSTSDGF